MNSPLKERRNIMMKGKEICELFSEAQPTRTYFQQCASKSSSSSDFHTFPFAMLGRRRMT